MGAVSLSGIFAENMASVTFENLGLFQQDRWLFRNLTLEIPSGSIVGISGPSGVGKTSLLNIMAGLRKPTEGEISYGGSAYTTAPQAYRQHIGFVFQNFLLSENNTALINTLCGGLNDYGWWRTLFGFPRPARERASTLLQAFGLGEYLHKPVNQLSGGEQQRVAITRALFQQPRVLLADEPVSNLDQRLRFDVLHKFRQEARKRGTTLFIVLHEPERLNEFADFLLVLDRKNADDWQLFENPGNVHSASKGCLVPVRRKPESSL